jgi:hypothetical protein
MTNKSMTAAVKIRIAERRAMALELRKQGGTFRQIAEQLAGRDGVSVKYDESHAFRDIQAELARLNTENQELVREIRDLELLRLDAMLCIYWPKAMEGDYQAFDRVLAILDRHARIFGFYQDTAFQATTRLNAAGKVALAGPQVTLSAEDQAIVAYVNSLSESEITAIVAEHQAQL